MKASNTDAVLELARERTLVNYRDLRERGIPPVYLHRLASSGRLIYERPGKFDTLPDAEIGTNVTLAEVCKRVPGGVVCLLSALRFHEVGTQLPHQVWLAIDGKAHKPKSIDLPIRIVRSSGAALTEGVELHKLPEGDVRVYSIPKTVADCFKFRSKIGLDVALEALREAWRGRRATMDQIWRAAEIDRVTTVIQPYLESLT